MKTHKRMPGSDPKLEVARNGFFLKPLEGGGFC